MPDASVADRNRFEPADIDADGDGEQLAERNAVASCHRIVQRHAERDVDAAVDGHTVDHRDADPNRDIVADTDAVALADDVGNAHGDADRNAVLHAVAVADAAHDAAALEPQLAQRRDRAG